MKKLLLTSLFSALGAYAALAQCGQRYHDKIFVDSVVSNIQYGSNIRYNNTSENLTLDIYFPKGDTETERPLIIMAHGGNFLGGSKTGTDVVNLCKDWCALGYVVASINYRVGMTNFPIPGPDSTDATEAVMRATHDGKASVRFFRESFENGNPYGIDTSHIFFAGVSAGGFIGLHMAYLDQNSEYPNYIDTVGRPGLSGGIEGISGHPGYSSKVHAIINICGALGDTAWIDAGDEPVLNFHGDDDGTVPYGSAQITLVGLYPLLQVDGSFSIAARATQLGIENCIETHEGYDHTPHISNAAIYDTTLNLSRNFLAHFVCNDALSCVYGPEITSVEEHVGEAMFGLFPNPANDHFTINMNGVNGTVNVEIIDMTGNTVQTMQVNQSTFDVYRNNLASGMYLIRVSSGNTSDVTRIVFE